jgi:D-aminoacyl-tRNA deacylase
LKEIAVVCSRADPASLNIFDCLLEKEDWKECEGYRSFGRWRLIVHDRRQSTLAGIEDDLAKLGLNPDLIVFASRHEAKSAMPWLGGHFTGVLEDGHAKLSSAAPGALRSFLQSIDLPGFAVSAEATHHGPVDIKTPCFFAEIGSTAAQWQDRLAGRAVAKAILAVEDEGSPVFLGFGGGHYVARQTDLMLKSSAAFGHLFSSYQTDKLDLEAVRVACLKSKASYAYLDRKSLRSQERKRLEGILAEMDLPVLRSREIRSEFPLPDKN